ncbi:MAG: peptidylprolyl isomerase [Deferrisomatales bacterium]
MRRAVGTRVWFGCLIWLLGALPARAAAPEGVREPPPVRDDPVVASVNGTPLRESDLAPFVEQLRKKYGRKGGGLSGALARAVRKEALEQLIAAELVYQAGLDETTGADGAEAPTGGHPPEGAHAAGAGVDRGAVIQRYWEALGVLSAPVPEEMVREYYEKNREAFRKRETAHVRHILVAVPEGADARARETARAKAEALRRKALEGADFAALAREASDCASAPSGGDLGRIPRGYMPAEFDRVAFALEPGEVGPVVETKFGFHVIRLEERNPGGVAPLPEVRDFIARYLRPMVVRKRMAEQVERLRREARVEVYGN